MMAGLPNILDYFAVSIVMRHYALLSKLEGYMFVNSFMMNTSLGYVWYAAIIADVGLASCHK